MWASGLPPKVVVLEAKRQRKCTCRLTIIVRLPFLGHGSMSGVVMSMIRGAGAIGSVELVASDARLL